MTEPTPPTITIDQTITQPLEAYVKRSDVDYFHLHKDNVDDNMDKLDDVARLFEKYIIHYKWNHSLDKCRDFLQRRLQTNSQLFIIYYQPNIDSVGTHNDIIDNNDCGKGDKNVLSSLFQSKNQNENNNQNNTQSIDRIGPKIAIGFCQLYPTWSSIAMEENWVLNDLFIDSQYRSLKIGTNFIGFILQWGDNSGAYSMKIETTQNNPRAQHLYPKLGFKEYTRFDDSIMYAYKYPRSTTQPYQSYYE